MSWTGGEFSCARGVAAATTGEAGDAPGRTMNVIDMSVIHELSDLVEMTAADDKVRGVVITSGKDTFCAGADLTRH